MVKIYILFSTIAIEEKRPLYRTGLMSEYSWSRDLQPRGKVGVSGWNISKRKEKHQGKKDFG